MSIYSVKILSVCLSVMLQKAMLVFLEITIKLKVVLKQNNSSSFLKCIFFRCLLEGGGSSDSFFVREDLKVGSVIGRLRIFGKYGNIP